MKSFVPLVYHRVCADGEFFASTYVVHAKAFRGQMEYLARKNYRVATVDDLLTDAARATDDAPRVLITFDDGYLDTYTTAYPILREFGYSALVFLVADFSRRTNWWDIPSGVPPANLLRPSHIAEMARGGIEFGSHSLTHRSLPDLSEGQRDREVVDSKSAIEDATGRPVRAFSYPYSHADVRTKDAVRRAGYACAFAVNSGPVAIRRDLWEIRRVNATTGAQGSRFAAKVNGFEKTVLWLWGRGRLLVPPRKRYEIRRGF